jgi:small subunit ribosomal protein S16e
MPASQKAVQTFGRKRNAVAVALAREGKGHVRLNGQPLSLVEPSIMRVKTLEPILLLGKDKFAGIDVRMRVRGGGQSAQVYAVRQALAKAVVAYAHKCEFCVLAGWGCCRGG